MTRQPAWLRPFLPFLQWWPNVTRAALKDDAMAGLTGAMIVLPQGVAFATIAGLPPEYGLYAAMVPAVIAALFGSSWHLVSGPTTAISIALFAALHGLAEPGTEQYIRLALTLTFLVGLYQLILGLARLGTLVNFISHTVVIGFTAGAAVLIAASQIKNFFGLNIPRGLPFYEILHQFWLQIGAINPYVTAVGALTLVAGLLARRYIPRFPYMIAAMIVGSLVAAALNALLSQNVTGIRTVGALASGLPPLSLPDFSLSAISQVAMPALVITMLALTEAASISRAIATRSEQRIDGNQEFVGQGLSNLIGSFFSAYASSGSFNRSGVNYEAGARTPLATVFASGFLIVILLLVAPLAAYLPNAAMAGILFLVAWGLIDFHHIRAIWSTSKPETAILWVTLIGTLVNLEEGILAGVLLSLVIYLYRTSRPELSPVVPVGEGAALRFVDAKGQPECPQIRFVRVHGSIYFGAVDHIQRALQQIDEDNPQHKTAVLVAPAINFVDVAGAGMLAQEARRRRRLGGGLYFWRLQDSVRQFLRQGEYLKDIGEGGFFPAGSNITGALYWTLDPDICRSCRARIFRECHGDLLPDGDRRLRLMFANDGSEYSRGPRAVALDLARRLGVTLDVMTVTALDAEPERAEQRLALVRAEAQALGVQCKDIVRQAADPIRAVIEAADAADCQLLVIGRTPPKGAAERKTGAHAARIIDEAPGHVLVVPKDAGPCRRRILVGFDANPSSQPAVEMAEQLAKAIKVPVTLVTAVKEGSPSAPVLTELAAAAVAALRLEGVEAEARTVAAAPAQALIDTARATGADLVILGRRQGGLNRLLPGSPTDRLIGAAEWPVLIAKSGPARLNDGSERA
ncbi:MAG: sulfate permease [Gallionellaceae bacterium]|nr:sulfate permease [Gallionellaceae bacterium]